MSEVIFIGTSDAFGAGGRRQSAIFVRTPRGGVLLDCGPTTLTGLEALGVSREEIDAIVISHFHGDHFGGIPLLLLGAKFMDHRTRPIQIVGPAKVERHVKQAAAGLGHPIDEADTPFEILYGEFKEGVEAPFGPVRIRAFETHHQPESSPHGFVIDAGDCRIAYSGDTGWFKELPARVRGVDLLITECTQYDGDFPLHLTHVELDSHKHEFDCGRIILTHLGPEMHARRGRCSFETADDGQVIRL